jgi:hypothetical protein
VSVLAHVFEQAGLATVGIANIRQQAVDVAPPRMLYCEFPLGRPLGKPSDTEFQRDVIMRAFALLERTDVPILEDHPEVITDFGEPPDSCPLPPRHDPDLHPAIDEAQGIRGAYDRNLERYGRTSMGRIAGPDGVTDLLQVLIDIEAGTAPADLGYDDAKLVALGQDVRAYYEEAGMQLAGPSGARELENWFFQVTEAGRLVRHVRDLLKEAGDHKLAGGYVAPASQR